MIRLLALPTAVLAAFGASALATAEPQAGTPVFAIGRAPDW
ncbi:hypothetical protein [Mycolicibacterium fluoranthenivorans]|uniref:Uncharacterized protein n=1 Tax=Mycolicibacterium fluoranthenivorans TaxID=258505 RepID=A0A7X5ZG96_9MYCO|nr:hypothetical protein [Mycolicibacterium fluoranthenivorans]NIH99025.1 hypothetical protein [Mycolicibacterium fluoranthenivorans]